MSGNTDISDVYEILSCIDDRLLAQSLRASGYCGANCLEVVYPALFTEKVRPADYPGFPAPVEMSPGRKVWRVCDVDGYFAARFRDNFDAAKGVA